MKPSILITGSEGLVGSRFTQISSYKSDLHSPKIVEFDITDKASVNAVIASYDLRAIINFAAFTDVNKAEEERNDRNGACWQINVEGVRNIAEAIKKSGKNTHFIQISTDMVFSGDKRDKGPYDEDHLPEKDLGRVTWYGFTKGEGENILRVILGDNATVVRIIYPVRARFEAKMDYLRKPLSLYDQGKLYPMFKDQQVSIAFIDEICVALDRIINAKIHGTFHVSSSDTTTPFDLVSYLLERTRGVKGVVKPSKLDEFIKATNSPVYRYPKFGGLSVAKSEKILDMKFSPWRNIVDQLVEQGIGNENSK